MTQAQDLALSLMLQQQAKETAPVVMAAPKERKLRVVREKEVPSHNGKNLSSAPAVEFKFPPGTYTARDFMIAWRRAKDRNEMMQAINGYTGYDTMAAFSVNEYNAKTMAQKELRPSHQVTAETQKTGKAFVAGLPDYKARKINDLLGREQLAAQALIEHELTAANSEEGSTQQLTALGMAEIERERLVAIRNDLASLR